MNRASMSAKKTLGSASRTSVVEALQPAVSSLTKSCYKNLLKEAAYFDRQPLAKALLSASPFLRKDSCWESLVFATTTPVATPATKKGKKTTSSTPSVPEVIRPAHGLTANTLALPTAPNSLQSFVRNEFRNQASAFDINRYFACMRRLELAKKLHTSCADEVSPALPIVTPPLQMTNVLPCAVNPTPPKASKAKRSSGKKVATPQPPAGLKPGSMLLAHPVLVDDFTQATVLVTTVNPDEGVTGLTLNVPYVPLQMVMASSSNAESTLRQRFPELWSKKIKAANQTFFNDWTVYSGGSIACAPLLVHKSAELAQGITRMNQIVNKKSGGGSKKSKIVEVDPAYAVQLPSGWWIHALSDVMMLEPSLVQNTVEEQHNARIVMNYSGWSEEQLEEEVCQNWWIQTEATSSCSALESLFQTVEVPKTQQKESKLAAALAAATGGVPASSSPTEATAEEKKTDTEIQYGTPSNYMWQRAVANLGGDLKDFARLKVVEEEEGDYRRMITSTFKDDLPTSAVTSSAPVGSSSVADVKTQ